jgi:hypothetical protein
LKRPFNVISDLKELKQMKNPFPVPPELTVDEVFECGNIEGETLALYQKLAEAVRAVEESDRRREEELAGVTDRFLSLIASLAGERFEFERLVRRMVPELVRMEAAELIKALDLFQRAWDQTLRRNKIEVLDISGWTLTDEIAEEIEVKGHVSDSGVTQTKVRETLAPLVRIEGRTIATAKVITSVAAREETPK